MAGDLGALWALCLDPSCHNMIGLTGHAIEGSNMSSKELARCRNEETSTKKNPFTMCMFSVAWLCMLLMAIKFFKLFVSFNFVPMQIACHE